MMNTVETEEGGAVRLPRGGYLVDTPEGVIQFGAPPETIKDTMVLPHSVPEIFVLPWDLFHWRKGINLADMEFPLYYNFFLKQKKTLIICTRSQAGRMIKALQEALFGPEDLTLNHDFPAYVAEDVIPNLAKEMNYFRGDLQFRDILNFGFFKGDVYSRGSLKIRINQNHKFEVFYNSDKLAEIPGVMDYQATYEIGKRLSEPYEPPLFGVTCLGPSHGFDPEENTSGFIIWLNHNGIMVDPPVNSTEWLEDSNVNPKQIDSIILTHCHADHDAGTLQKILEEGKITVYTTQTIMQSFLRKYSSLTDESVSYIKRLFHHRRVTIGQPVFIHGGKFIFFYSLHSIPTLGFTLEFQDQTFVYSSDHQGDPEVQKKIFNLDVINRQRYEELTSFPWESKVIYHESGIPPLHTPITFLNSLPEDIQKKVVVYHIAKKDFPARTALTLATFGIDQTLYFKTQAPPYEKTYQTLGVLKHLDFFDSLPVEKAQEFVSIVEEEKFKKGDYIIRKDTKGDKFYIIASGNALVIDEDLVANKILGTYEYFGEVALMTEKPRTADIKAETDTIVYTIGKDKFLSFILGTDFERTLQRLIKNRSSETWNTLIDSPMCQPLTTYQKTWLESLLVPRELSGSGVLIREGEPLEEVYIIRKGEVEVSRAGKHIATLGRGHFIGEMHKIHRGEAAEYTFRYQRPVSLFTIKKIDVLEFMEKNPGLGMKLAYDI
jgi:CRP-like cAMP-binding protein/phosphoribosyl 1,2-cyclic phosphodiesterase